MNDTSAGDWITDAPANYTVAEAEDDERRGTAWPISGDATTITNCQGGNK